MYKAQIVCLCCCFVFRKSWYLPAPAVSPKSALDFKLVSRDVSEWGAVKLSFEANGKQVFSRCVSKRVERGTDMEINR